MNPKHKHARKTTAIVITAASIFILTTPSIGQVPASALVNQGSEETLEAARAASPHTSESTYAYFQENAEDFLAKTSELGLTRLQASGKVADLDVLIRPSCQFCENTQRKLF